LLVLLGGLRAPLYAQATPVPVTSVPEPAEFGGMLAAHNQLRREVGTPALQWSPEAALVAQSWADRLVREQSCAAQHSPGEDRRRTWGENVYRYAGKSAYAGFARDPAYVVNAWAASKPWYQREGNRCNAPPGRVCGPYTQLVSYYSTHVGCGRARCAAAEVWVCNYSPPGNYENSPPY
jgi:hypothetical protein